MIFLLLSRCRHPACAPLMIPISDEDYNRLPSCLNYVRSALDVNPECKFGQAQQVNVIFHQKIPAEKTEIIHRMNYLLFLTLEYTNLIYF